jgi:hypothetical protein
LRNTIWKIHRVLDKTVVSASRQCAIACMWQQRHPSHNNGTSVEHSLTVQIFWHFLCLYMSYESTNSASTLNWNKPLVLSYTICLDIGYSGFEKWVEQWIWEAVLVALSKQGFSELEGVDGMVLAKSVAPAEGRTRKLIKWIFQTAASIPRRE